MKSVKKLLFILIGAFSTGFIATSCNDDFSEEDLLKLQVELGTEADSLAAVKALEALNTAGEMVSFQVKIVDTDGMGVEGLDVTMAAAAEGGVADNQTLVTDASGLVFFDRVAIGGNTVSISGETIIGALLSVDFGSIQQGTHYQIIDGQIIPTPVTENAIITVLGATAATATVTGIATIETDLTNDTKEVPQDLTILADFDDGLVETASINVNYFFATNDNALSVGAATVDNTTGAYSMEVPAGVAFDLIIPQIQADQRVAINGIDDNDLAQPEYRNILTDYGSNFGTDFIPTVPGARIVFDAPGDGGEGFTLALTREGRTLPNATYSSSSPQDISDLIVQFTNRGSSYIASPDIAITDPTGSGAYAQAHLTVNNITGLSVTNAGTNYAISASYFFDVYIDYSDQDDNIFTSQIYDNALLVTTDGGGLFTQSNVDAAIAAAAGDDFFGDAVDLGNNKITAIRLVADDNADGNATLTVTAADSEVNEFVIMDGGSDYTGPKFAFSGDAAVTVHDFGTSWAYDLDNSGVTTPYTLLPSSITFYYQPVSLGNVSESSSSVSISDFVVDGDGNIQFADALDTYETGFYSSVMPRVVVVETESIQASRYINSFSINEDGQVNGISTYSDELYDFSSNNGEGYSDVYGATIVPSIDGAPGSGATVEITSADFLSNGEYQWYGGYIFTNQGSGYLQNLNVQNSTSSYNVSGDLTNVRLLQGAKHVVNINYGTGNKYENVH